MAGGVVSEAENVRDRLAALLPSPVRAHIEPYSAISIYCGLAQAGALAERLEQAEKAGDGGITRCDGFGHVSHKDGGCVLDGCGCPCHVGWDRAAEEVSAACGDAEGYTLTEMVGRAVDQVRDAAEADHAAVERARALLPTPGEILRARAVPVHLLRAALDGTGGTSHAQ